jgi:hypothetical protein
VNSRGQQQPADMVETIGMRSALYGMSARRVNEKNFIGG